MSGPEPVRPGRRIGCRDDDDAAVISLHEIRRGTSSRVTSRSIAAGSDRSPARIGSGSAGTTYRPAVGRCPSTCTATRRRSSTSSAGGAWLGEARSLRSPPATRSSTGPRRPHTLLAGDAGSPFSPSTGAQPNRTLSAARAGDVSVHAGCRSTGRIRSGPKDSPARSSVRWSIQASRGRRTSSVSATSRPSVRHGCAGSGAPPARSKRVSTT